MSKRDDIFDVIVIGGGAAGLTAAIAAGREQPSLRVLLLERQERVGRKLLATGNGRCNYTNIHCESRHYHGRESEYAQYALNRFHPLSNIRFFEELGVVPRVEDEGKVFPFSGQAGAVLDALRLEAEHRQVTTICNVRVDALDRRNGLFVAAAGKREFRGRRLILACGGQAAPDLGGTDSGLKLLAACGHTIVPCYPSLVQIKTDNTIPKQLKGLKFRGVATLLNGSEVIGAERGEILFTEYGLSGPPVLQLSHYLGAHAFGQIRITLDLLPEFTEEKLLELLTARRADLAHLTLEYFLGGLVAKKIGLVLLKQAVRDQLSRSVESLTDSELRQLVRQLKSCTLPVLGTVGWKNAQVTSGGAATADFDPQTMESRRLQGLYAVGELLDIDGDCGGYNLQWAWASGRLAGESAARSLNAGAES